MKQPMKNLSRHRRNLGLICALSFSALACLSPAVTSAKETAAGESSADVADADVSQGPQRPVRTVDVVPVTTDDQIRSRLSRILNASKWIERAEVTVDEGIVFLAGSAEDEQYSQWAADVARNTQDVVAVVNNIEVQDDIDVGQALGHVRTSLSVLWRDFLKRLPLIAAAIIVLFMTAAVNKVAAMIVTRTARRSGLRPSLRDLLIQLTTFFVWLTGLMVAAIVVFPGMTPAKLLTVLGLSSVAIGFAFKDIFENFFAGILILWRFPFDAGDYIECGEIEGKVEAITIRMSQIRQVDGQLVVVPNALLFKQPVHVLTNSKTRRVTVICGVAYGEDVDQCREVIEQAVTDCKTVETEKPIEVFARQFGASSIDFEVTWWTGSTPLEVRQSRDEVVAKVKRSLDEAGIEIPFPYRTLTFNQPLQLINASDGNDSDSV